ncbi:serine/threonine protein kinase [Priestia koreensis]|uniref:serine/threonine protein kinase n=1 Tax=Priestia koreensis TaxID=284581 RepID=UPI001F55FACB|nr:protein kinase [Priestia koreensis]UNL86231.1 protein kinase [Priestia koreensis]
MSWFHQLYEYVKDRPLKDGDVIDHQYKIQTLLGRGSYGITYIATDLVTDESVVLKQLRPTKQKLERGKRSFQYECELLQFIQHPQIPSLHRSVQDKKGSFLIMDYVKGHTFEDLIFRDDRRYSESESLTILLKVIDVVSDLHDQGIVHRDLRIPNIIDVGDTIHIIDFGLARWKHDTDPDIHTYDVEKRLMRSVTVKSDIYALGHFLLFLLYSSYETEGTEEKSWEQELPLSVPLKEIIRRMLQIEGEYESIRDLQVDVLQYLSITK